MANIQAALNKTVQHGPGSTLLHRYWASDDEQTVGHQQGGVLLDAASPPGSKRSKMKQFHDYLFHAQGRQGKYLQTA